MYTVQIERSSSLLTKMSLTLMLLVVGLDCFQNLCVLVLWMKVASALEGLSLFKSFRRLRYVFIQLYSMFSLLIPWGVF